MVEEDDLTDIVAVWCSNVSNTEKMSTYSTCNFSVLQWVCTGAQPNVSGAVRGRWGR